MSLTPNKKINKDKKQLVFAPSSLILTNYFLPVIWALVFQGSLVLKYIFAVLIIMGGTMEVNGQEPEWVSTLRVELGDDIMAKSAMDLTAEDVFNIVRVTKNINGADDGTWPMVEAKLPQIRLHIISLLNSGKVSKEELETINYLASIFFESDKELQVQLKN
ncbi:MAG: hypothetical protein QNK36_04740 [Colwellia sp.]|nr:hypothetical protein [Colwellia sp.]